jgi:hypothetical protein
MPNIADSILFAYRNGNLKLWLGTTDADGNTPLTVSWTDATVTQEGTSQLSIVLTSAQLATFQGLIAELNLNALPWKYKVETTAGAATRTDGARLTPDPDPNHDLGVAFYTRTTDGITSNAPTSIPPPVTFSKASFVNGLEYTEEWRATWERAIALAWSDPNLQQALVADPFSFFKTYCNYALPPTVELLIVPPSALSSTYGFSPCSVSVDIGTSGASPVFASPSITSGSSFSGSFSGMVNVSGSVTVSSGQVSGGTVGNSDGSVQLTFSPTASAGAIGASPSLGSGVADGPISVRGSVRVVNGVIKTGNVTSGTDWTWTLPRSVLIMYLPPKPSGGKDIAAVALAAYDAVGKSYPFTVTS